MTNKDNTPTLIGTVTSLLTLPFREHMRLRDLLSRATRERAYILVYLAPYQTLDYGAYNSN